MVCDQWILSMTFHLILLLFWSLCSSNLIWNLWKISLELDKISMPHKISIDLKYQVILCINFIWSRSNQVLIWLSSKNFRQLIENFIILHCSLNCRLEKKPTSLIPLGFITEWLALQVLLLYWILLSSGSTFSNQPLGLNNIVCYSIVLKFSIL